MTSEITNIQKPEIVLYQPDHNTTLEVRLENETVWLTQAQMAELFLTTRNNVTLHIRNIFKEGELQEISVCKESLLTAADGKQYNTKIYNLDVIISVGYRVKSQRGTMFRQWATTILKQHLLQGYSVNRQLIALQQHVDERFMRIEDKLQDHDKQLDFFIPFDKFRVNSLNQMAYTYILRLANNQYYVGSTLNLKNRIQEHCEGRDKFTRNHLPASLVYYEEYSTQEEAWRREKQLHGWSRTKKEKLIAGEWRKQPEKV